MTEIPKTSLKLFPDFFNNNNEITLKEFATKSSNYCIIIGVLNEGDRFTSQLNNMQEIKHIVDIVIADGGSNDGSVSESSVCNQAMALIVDKRNKGLSGQYQTALAFAVEKKYLGMVMIDGNGKDGIEAVPLFLSAIAQGADLVQGSRFLPGGEHLNTPWIRYFAIRKIFCPLMFLFTGFAYSDAINGFKAVSYKLLMDENVRPFRKIFSSYSLQYYFNYRAAKLKFNICEIPVRRNYPANGQIPTKINGLKSYINIIRLLMLTCFGYFNPSEGE